MQQNRSNPDFSSLNLAAAVQVVVYELYIASMDQQKASADTESSVMASAGQLESFYSHLYEVMSLSGFIHVDKSRSIMRRLRRLFNRARLETKEIDILRGVLSATGGSKIQRSDNRRSDD